MQLKDAAKGSLPNRIIGHIQGKTGGPTLLFFGGIHGNEEAGVKALESVFLELEPSDLSKNGTLYGIRGNMPALLRGKRFLDKDLNRLWTEESIKTIQRKPKEALSTEERELTHLYELISGILAKETGPFYFFDLHTTSSKTLPFITINDALINRRFSKLFPVPIILGIEEYLEGPLLSFINAKGYVSLGFEAGQHFNVSAIKNSIAFVWLAMIYGGFLNRSEVPDHKGFFKQLQESSEHNANFYEIVYRHQIPKTAQFKMKDGFKSFSKVKKGRLLAFQNNREIQAEKDTIVFMPLYQELGEDGYFLIKRIPLWALGLSTVLRRVKLGSLLHLLPGVSWANGKQEALLVNTKIAPFFTKSFFHLLGYRNKVLDKTHFAMNNRELTAKNEMYRRTWWYRLTTNKSL